MCLCVEYHSIIYVCFWWCLNQISYTTGWTKPGGHNAITVVSVTVFWKLHKHFTQTAKYWMKGYSMKKVNLYPLSTVIFFSDPCLNGPRNLFKKKKKKKKKNLSFFWYHQEKKLFAFTSRIQCQLQVNSLWLKVINVKLTPNRNQQPFSWASHVL